MQDQTSNAPVAVTAAETVARFTTVGCATAWFAFRGSKVLCDKLIRARRFASEAAALKAGRKANGEAFR